MKRAYDEFVKRSMQIATAKDLDVLLAQLKGDSSDLLLKAVEEPDE